MTWLDFWRSKVKVTAGGRGGEGIHRDPLRSTSTLGFVYSLRLAWIRYVRPELTSDEMKCVMLIYLDQF